MDQLQPDDLPEFLDPLVDFLADKLPPPVYDALFQFSSYTLMFFSSLLKLASALPSIKPWEWDAQTVIPPLIVVLSIYYVLASMYRTTSFFIRMAFRLLKWGSILSILGGAYTWLMYGEGGNGNDIGVVGMLNRFLGGNTGGASVNTGRRQRTSRPKAWDSFTAHQQWQYNEDEARRSEAAGSGSDMQRAVQYIAGLAGQFMTGSPAEVFKSFMESASQNGDENGGSQGSTGTRKQPKRKAKTKGQRKTSSR